MFGLQAILATERVKDGREVLPEVDRVRKEVGDGVGVGFAVLE